MNASDRSSGRVVEPSTNNLVTTTPRTFSGADGRAPLDTHNTRGGRVGQRQLTSIKSSLSNRQLSILAQLTDLKFLAGTAVQRLLYPPSEFTSLSAARSSRRDLAKLFELKLIDRLDRRIGGLRAGSGSFVYKLSPLGARILGHDSRRRSREPSRAHLDHVLAVAELVIQLHETTRTDPVELLEVQTEPDCWRPVIGTQGSRILLKPDLRLTLGVGDKELHWFVEVDRGSEHRPVLARKCQTYLSAWRDGREQAQAGVFPRVLWIVPDKSRSAVLESVVQSLNGAPPGMFAVSTNDQAIGALLDQGGRP